MDFTISNISVKSGTRLNERLTYAKKPDGEPLTIPLSIINGKNSGPVLCLNTGTHGDEPEGTIAILDILEEIDPLNFSGVLVGIPALNVSAFTSKVSVDVSGIRENHLDWKNLARIFPGNPQGTVTERLADTVVKEIIPKVDYVVDFHSGGSRGTSHFISGFVGVDNDGNTGLAFGVLGLPETFLTNTNGRIIYKHTGQLTKKIIQNNIIPLLQ